jgi:hypothetical protein
MHYDEHEGELIWPLIMGQNILSDHVITPGGRLSPV